MRIGDRNEEEETGGRLNLCARSPQGGEISPLTVLRKSRRRAKRASAATTWGGESMSNMAQRISFDPISTRPRVTAQRNRQMPQIKAFCRVPARIGHPAASRLHRKSLCHSGYVIASGLEGLVNRCGASAAFRSRSTGCRDAFRAPAIRPARRRAGRSRGRRALLRNLVRLPASGRAHPSLSA